MGDLQLEESTLRAHGKGNKERIVPVAHTTVEIIQNYLLHDRHHYCKSELEAHVFLSQQGRPQRGSEYGKSLKNRRVQLVS